MPPNYAINIQNIPSADKMNKISAIYNFLNKKSISSTTSIGLLKFPILNLDERLAYLQKFNIFLHKKNYKNSTKKKL